MITLTLTGEAAKDTEYTVTIQKYIEAQDKWVDAATQPVTVRIGNDTVTSSNVTLATGGIYRAVCGGVVSENVTH